MVEVYDVMIIKILTKNYYFIDLDNDVAYLYNC